MLYLYKLSIDLKELGSEHYKNENIYGALNEYEKSLALFKWLEPKREDWKKRVSFSLVGKYVYIWV